MNWLQVYEESLKSVEYRQAAKDNHEVLSGFASALHGAVLMQNQDIFDKTIEAIFFLGFRAGREDARLDVFRAGLEMGDDDEHAF